MELETFLQTEDCDRLVWLAESSLHVKNHPSFFLGSQGALQMLLPHEILICGVKNGGARSFQMRRFSSCRYFKDEHFEAVCDPQNGLISRTVAQWLRIGERSKPTWRFRASKRRSGFSQRDKSDGSQNLLPPAQVPWGLFGDSSVHKRTKQGRSMERPATEKQLNQ
jgi:hypothetical protein